MTDDWIREQIHKFCGVIGDPLEDLNVVHEAEKILINKGKETAYLTHLTDVCRPNGADPDSIDDLISAVRATAHQRAEALFLTIEGYKNAATKRP